MLRILFICLICAASFGVWEGANRPLEAPRWTGLVDGFAYSPMRPGQSPEDQAFPSPEQIEADLALIAAHGRSVRTYSLDGTLAMIPALAAKYALPVTAGVWLDGDPGADRVRLQQLEQVVAANPNVERVVVGNETLLTEVLTPAALGGYLRDVRDSLAVPVSTAEPWHIWLAHPELADAVDFLTVHLLPYWEGVPADAAVTVVTARMQDLAERYPDKPIVIGEVGWPSNGRSRGAAAATRHDAETFLRRFLTLAAPAQYDYFLMEAFDQPWKRALEGEVGAYWGLYDGDRKAKYALDEILRPIPERRGLALIAAVIAAAGFLLLAADAKRMRWPGLALLAAMSWACANLLVWTLHDYFGQYWTPGSIVAAAVMLAGLAGIVVLISIEVHEWAEAAFKRRTRTNLGPPAAAAGAEPKVSIHVPACDEPPSMLIDTLNALAGLDYYNYEVLVVDNNTRNESRWLPVQAHCERLGAQFRFFHVSPLAGFKAGALNFALEHTAPDAQIIAVIDSDYRVERDWLRRLVPYFQAAGTALVQAPQDYRDHGAHAFKRFCEAEYRGFFHVGMVTRNERNAIIQHGTMTMIRASVLREVGGWAQWSVTEDAELGLRILEHGYEAVYTTESFGRGLTPDRFRDYRSQRFRWAIGAAQILRRHARRLLGLESSRLSLGQRFHFLTGWAAWLGDGLNLVFNFIAIAWSLLMVLAPEQFLAPVARFSGFVLAFFAFKLIKMAWLYKSQVRATTLETVAAIVAGLALVFITGRAVLAGLAGSDARFVRTPKLARRDSVFGALESVANEAVLAACLLTLAVAVALTATFDVLDRRLWSLLLVVFALPHLAAVGLSLLSTMPPSRKSQPATRLGDVAADAHEG